MGGKRGNPQHEALDAAAIQLVQTHGHRAAQLVVDDIQAAIRAGAEAEAMKHEKRLQQVEAVLRHPRYRPPSVLAEIGLH